MRTVYCVDTSSLIDAWVRRYPRDIFPALWEKVEALIRDGRFCSPEEVAHELEKKEDDLCRWAKAQGRLWVSLDLDQSNEVKLILSEFPLLVDSSKNRSIGDPFVIALAKLRSHIVVTQEFSGSVRLSKKPKIPDVCTYYNIECIDLLELIRREKWTF